MAFAPDYVTLGSLLRLLHGDSPPGAITIDEYKPRTRTRTSPTRPAAGTSCSSRTPAIESQRRPAAVRARRLPLHRNRRRRRRGRSRPRRPEPEAPSPARSSASIHAERDGERTRSRPTTRSTASRRVAARSGPTVSATPGASRSTARPATSRSATSARTSGRRSTSARAPRAMAAARTTAGAAARGATTSSRTNEPPCTGLRRRSSPSRSHRVPAWLARLLDHRRLCRPRPGAPASSAATSTATTARRRSGTSSSRFPTRRATRTPGENVSALYTFGEDACARVYAGSGTGAVYRLVPTTPPPPPHDCTPRGGTLLGVIQDEGGSEISLRDPQGTTSTAARCRRGRTPCRSTTPRRCTTSTSRGRACSACRRRTA